MRPFQRARNTGKAMPPGDVECGGRVLQESPSEEGALEPAVEDVGVALPSKGTSMCKGLEAGMSAMFSVKLSLFLLET